MDIRYIKKSAEKLSPDNIMSIINDFVMKTDLEVIQNYDPNKTYYKNDKVYLKYNDKHRVFICNTTTVTGEFDISKWRPFFKKETKIATMNQLDTFEETIVVDRDVPFDYKIKVDDFKYKNTSVAAFNSINPRLRYGIDFRFTSDGVVKFLKPFNIGERVILEVRRLNGNLFNNMFKEVYVEETYIPLKKTRFVPIQYPGYTASSKLEVFNEDGNLLEEGIDYTLDGAYIILKNSINAGYRMTVTMWNKVMITITSEDYIMDELGNFYKLCINDYARLKLEEVDDVVLSKGYIDLITDDGTYYRCSANSKKQLVLSNVEPDVIIAADGKKYKICIDENGQLYLEEVEIEFYKNIYLISTDENIYELFPDNGVLNAEKLESSGVSGALEGKHIISDDNRVYEIYMQGSEILIRELISPHNDENPIKYLNLISESGLNFMFFAANDGHIAVRCSYIVDNNSNIIVGDDGCLYYLGMTNDGEFYTQLVRAAPFAAEHKILTDDQCIEYEIHVDKQQSVYFIPTGNVTSKVINITLDSDAKDSYICGIIENYFSSYPYSKSSILKDVRTGFEYRLYIENGDIKIARIPTELIEKDSIPLIKSNKYYELIVRNGKVELYDTGIILPEKEDVTFKMTNQDGSKEYILSVSDDGNIVIS